MVGWVLKFPKMKRPAFGEAKCRSLNDQQNSVFLEEIDQLHFEDQDGIGGDAW